MAIHLGQLGPIDKITYRPGFRKWEATIIDSITASGQKVSTGYYLIPEGARKPDNRALFIWQRSYGPLPKGIVKQIDKEKIAHSGDIRPLIPI